MQISGPGATIFEQLCAFMRELFMAYGVCSQPFIRQKLETLRKNDTRALLRLCLSSLCAHQSQTRTRC